MSRTSPNFSEIEREVLAYWADDGTFEASVKARSGAHEYVFYDGPAVCQWAARITGTC